MQGPSGPQSESQRAKVCCFGASPTEQEEYPASAQRNVSRCSRIAHGVKFRSHTTQQKWNSRSWGPLKMLVRPVFRAGAQRWWGTEFDRGSVSRHRPIAIRRKSSPNARAWPGCPRSTMWLWIGGKAGRLDFAI